MLGLASEAKAAEEKAARSANPPKRDPRLGILGEVLLEQAINLRPVKAARRSTPQRRDKH